MKINGYSMFINEDEAIYCAKSKEDVYKYFVDNYGTTEDCQSQTKDEFIDQLDEIDLNSEYSKRIRTWIDEDNGETFETSFYAEYEKSAKNDQGTEVIAFLTW